MCRWIPLGFRLAKTSVNQARIFREFLWIKDPIESVALPQVAEQIKFPTERERCCSLKCKTEMLLGHTNYIRKHTFSIEQGLSLAYFVSSWVWVNSSKNGNFRTESYKSSMGQFHQGLSCKLMVTCLPCDFVWMLDIVYEKPKEVISVSAWHYFPSQRIYFWFLAGINVG